MTGDPEEWRGMMCLDCVHCVRLDWLNGEYMCRKLGYLVEPTGVVCLTFERKSGV